MNNYKDKYLKYKLKYLLLGGSTILNQKNLDNMEKIYIETLKKHLKNFKKYQSKFLNGIKIKDFIILCNELLKIHNKFDFNLKQQIEFIVNYNKNINYKNINYLILDNLIKYYKTNILENNNDIEKINYLKNNSILNIDNNKIKKYDLNKILGEGDFGITYDVNNNIVLKTIDISTFKINSKYDKFFNLQNIINEINIMIKLNNSNISPKLIDTWIYYNHNNILYIAILMEHKGIALSTWEKKNTLTKQDYEKINKKIDELHKNNIIHKDLHKSNILVQEINNNRDFFIADFGLSKTFKQIIDNFKQEDYNRYNINSYKISNIQSEYLKELLLLLDFKFIKM